MVECPNTYKLYKCKEVDFNKKVDVLKKMIEIYDNKELSETNKAYQLLKLCNKYSEFETKYRLLFENGANDPRLVDIHKYIPLIYKKLKKYKDLGCEEDFAAIRILERKIINSNFEKSKNIIFAYIESEHFVEEEILDDIGVTSLEFKKHLRNVETIFPNLYQRYLIKCKENLTLRYNDCINSFIDIANAIKTGSFIDGTKFSILEFWARVPLRENHKHYDLEFEKINHNLEKFGFDFMNRVKPFVKATLEKEQQDIIINFIVDNKLGRISNTMTYSGIKDRYRGMNRITKKYVNENNEEVLIDFDFTEEDFNNIIEYMNLRRMPLIYEIFEVVLFEYIKGNITKDTINEKRNIGLKRKKC